MHRQLIAIAREQGVGFTESGSYVNIQGPAFSTRAESKLYRSWGMSVVGMTSMYEARLCREAELHFGTIAQVTDYDSWKEQAVDVPAVVLDASLHAQDVMRLDGCVRLHRPGFSRQVEIRWPGLYLEHLHIVPARQIDLGQRLALLVRHAEQRVLDREAEPRIECLLLVRIGVESGSHPPGNLEEQAHRLAPFDVQGGRRNGKLPPGEGDDQ